MDKNKVRLASWLLLTHLGDTLMMTTEKYEPEWLYWDWFKRVERN